MTTPQFPGPPDPPYSGPPYPGPPYPGPKPSRWTGARIAGVVAGAIAAILVAVLVVVLVVGGDDDDNAAATGGEVFLEPTAAAGADPFSGSAATPQPAATNPGPDPVGGTPSSAGLRTASGEAPGLYGGTRNLTTCDVDLLINYLLQNPDKGRAWAGVEGIDISQIPTYVRELTPVLLRTDTRVTNHGFAGGRAYARQSVLQSGTAVLVDKFGAPRVRCYCGNPLLDPVAIPVTPAYTGPRWPRFAPETIIVIKQTTVIIDIFTLYDPVTGTTFGRPRGGTGTTDVNDPRTATTVTTPPVQPTIQPPPQQPRQPAPEQPSGPTDEELARQKLAQADAQCYPFPYPIKDHESQDVSTTPESPATFVLQVIGYAADGEVQDFQWAVDRATLSFTPLTSLAQVASDHCPLLN